MERKTKLEIGLAVAVLIFFLAFLIYWKMQNTPVADVPAVAAPAAITTAKDKPKTPSTSSTTAQTPAAVAVHETSAITVARTFVERLGSYSSEADAANIEDIIPMATASFQKKLEALVKEVRSNTDSSYYSISTLVMTAPKTVSASATETVLSMTTQRIETIDTPGNSTKKYQNITVTLVKSGTTWLVDGYTWTDGT